RLYGNASENIVPVTESGGERCPWHVAPGTSPLSRRHVARRTRHVLRELPRDPSFADRHGDAVAIHDAVPCGGPHAIARRDDPGEVQRIRRADGDEPPGRG